MEAAIRAMMEFYKIDREQAIRLLQKSGFEHKDLRTPEQKKPWGHDTEIPHEEWVRRGKGGELGPAPEEGLGGVGNMAGGERPIPFGAPGGPRVDIGEVRVSPAAPTLGPRPPAPGPNQARLDALLRLAELANKPEFAGKK